jgi:hypothetical protein
MEMPTVVLGEYSTLYRLTAHCKIANTFIFRHTLIPPRGYSIAGIYGSCGPWIDGFGLIITR